MIVRNDIAHHSTLTFFKFDLDINFEFEIHSCMLLNLNDKMD